MDWNAVFTGIALVAAIISPIVTAIINNHYQTKMKRLQFFDEHRAEVIENYIRFTGSVSKMSSGFEEFRNFGKYSKEIYLYVSEDLWRYIDQIEELLYNRNYDDAHKILAVLCKELKKDPPRLKSRRRNRKNK